MGRCLARLGSLCLATLPTLALPAHGDSANVQQIMAEACATRGLALPRPVAVQPMTAFQGGYTPGVGSVSWDDDYAEQWRAGWCALGVYCVFPEGEAKAATAQRRPDDRRLADPSGLYDRERNVLFVRETGAEAAATIAHETVHALQFQNHPHLRALHPWHNRDLSAAASTALEGDAHVVGQTFDPARRLHLCSIDPRSATATHRQWWGWQPDALWAYEGLPHVFGPEQALRRALRSHTAGLDAWLRQPPLSTLAVLRPSSAIAVDFIRVPADILGAALTARNCVPRLSNTAGALGIWGLLAQHGNVERDDLPELLHHWRGDRFVHVECPGQGSDELAWLTRWSTRKAAREFAARYQTIAPAIAAHGKVLASAPTAFARRRNVVVATPGLHHAVAAITRSRRETFASYGDWIAGGCFPQRGCDIQEPTTLAGPGDHVCATKTDAAPRLRNWLERVRTARAATAITSAEARALAERVAALATFCAKNGARNTDFAQACRAVYGGVRFQLQLREDAHWRLLPHCATPSEMRDWVRETYYPQADGPDADAQAFAGSPAVAGVYGLPLAARVLAEQGSAGLAALTTRTPVSTRQLLWPDDDPVEFMRLPPAALAKAGCEATASDLRGILGIWNLLLDHGGLPPRAPPPPWLRDWRGDRQNYLRCAEHGEGWAWVSRWRTLAAAESFAAAYNALAPTAAIETGLAGNARAHGRDVWVLPPKFAALTARLQAHLEARRVHDLQEWRAAGCFPASTCR